MTEPRGDYTKGRSTIDLEERTPYKEQFEDEREGKSRLTAVPPADPSVVSSRSAPSATPSASSPERSRDSPSAGSICTIKNIVISVGGLLTFTATVATILGFVLDLNQATLNADIVKATKNPTRLPTPPPTKNQTPLRTSPPTRNPSPLRTPPPTKNPTLLRTPPPTKNPTLLRTPPPTKNLTLLRTPPPTKNPTPLRTSPPTGKIVNVIMESLGDDEFKESKTGNSLYSDTDHNWTNYDWIELPDDIQNLFTSLGYDQFAWDNTLPTKNPTPLRTPPPTGTIVNIIMESLGDDEFKESKTGDSVYSDTGHNWTNYDWIELPDYIKILLTSLGYDQFAWDNALPSEYETLYWNDLSLEQQNAAMTLFQEDEASWNGWVYETEENDNNIYMNDWEDYCWSGLPQAIKDAMTVLGWGESAWDNGESVSTESMMWSELSSDQQNAAELYGYDQQTWDAAVDTL